MNSHLLPEEKLALLQTADPRRKWSSLDDQRICVLCDRTITGRQIEVSSTGRACTPWPARRQVAPRCRATGFIAAPPIRLTDIHRPGARKPTSFGNNGGERFQKRRPGRSRRRKALTEGPRTEIGGQPPIPILTSDL